MEKQEGLGVFMRGWGMEGLGGMGGLGDVLASACSNGVVLVHGVSFSYIL